jgi:hypothetical protein
LADRLDRAVRDPSQLDDALSEKVHVFQDIAMHVIEQLMERGERRSTDVPVRLLGVSAEIDRVDQAFTEQGDEVAPGILVQRIACGMERSEQLGVRHGTFSWWIGKASATT